MSSGTITNLDSLLILTPLLLKEANNVRININLLLHIRKLRPKEFKKKLANGFTTNEKIEPELKLCSMAWESKLYFLSFERNMTETFTSF